MNAMKKHLFLTAMMVAALFFLGGCHHSGNHPDPDPDPDPDNPVNNTPPSPWLSVNDIPDWEIDWNANDPRPDWKAPDVSNYESWMIIMVKVPDPIAPFVSSDVGIVKYFLGGIVCNTEDEFLYWIEKLIKDARY